MTTGVVSRSCRCSDVSGNLRFVATYRGEIQLEALGDGSRRAIVELLAERGPLAVTRIAEILPISRPAVSQHLKVLKKAGLVQDEAQGTRRIYTLDDAGLSDLRAYFAQFWRADLDDYAAFVRTQVGDPTEDES